VNPAVLGFLRHLGERPELLETLKVRSKDDVLAAAPGHGFVFTEAEFDASVWDVEVRLAQRRGEPFDAHFPLWQTMWGRYYLDYLVTELLPSLDETGLASRPA
jgi:hypothetical protein